MLRQIVDHPGFALVDVFLVLISGAVWMLSPGVEPWIILIALLPWSVRMIAGRFPFRRTRFDWLLLIFLITAWLAYWSAYDKASAWNKIWLIVLAILLYYALVSQPGQNLVWVSLILFGVGIGTSIYFFLTHDFTNASVRIASWWMNTRPQFGWPAIHQGYISGIVAITTLYSLHGISKIRKITSRNPLVLSRSLINPGLGIMIGAFLFSASRGIWLAIAGAIVTWMLWKLLITSKPGFASVKWLSPIVILICLLALVTFAYIGPAILNADETQSRYGDNTRLELFLRSAYFLEEYPFIGGGLDSFPGLYSQYQLVIPHHYFINSYNLFLDVAIEQGVIGGLAFLLVYVGCVWHASQAFLKAQSTEKFFLDWVSLFVLMIVVVHGMFYDYLYNGMGTFLLFLPTGISMNRILQSAEENGGHVSVPFSQSKARETGNRSLSLAVSGMLIILVLFSGQLRSMWHSNLGAVQMSKVELMGFPSGQWMDSTIVPGLEAAETSLHSSLRFDGNRRTTNHRLGLISMLRTDFDAAVGYLEVANKYAPGHRGIIKSLGYCYVWLGDFDNAQRLLAEIPEASEELAIYVWWWGERGRHDLSEKALQMVPRLVSGSTLR